MTYYSEILAFHIIAVLSWMTLVFYMPRLFVYHQEHKNTKAFTDVVKVQELKIYKIIGFPAMLASIISGATLVFLNPSLLEQNWFIAKLIILVLMIIYTLSLEHFRKVLDNKPKKERNSNREIDRNTLSNHKSNNQNSKKRWHFIVGSKELTIFLTLILL